MCGFHSEGRKKQHLVTAIKNDTSMDEKKLQVWSVQGFYQFLTSRKTIDLLTFAE